VWCIFGLHLTLLGAYTILVPTYRSPDEPLHVDLAHHWSTDFEYPDWNERETGSDVIRSLDLAHFQERAAHLTTGEATPKSERRSFEELEDAATARGINHMPQHPPLYYVIAGTAERATEVVIGDPDFQLETWIYRLLSVAIVAPLPLVIWRTSRTLALPDVVGVTAMLVPLAIPQYLHIGSSVNNDGPQFLLIWIMTPIILRLARGELGTRTVVTAGVITGLGLLTKGFAFVTVAWVGCALLLALGRLGRSALPRIGRAGLTYGVISAALGGWWWIRNLVVSGMLMPSRYGEIIPDLPSDERDVGHFIRVWADLTNRRFWGDFGYFDTHIPLRVISVATVVAVLSILIACVGRDRLGGTRRADRLLLLAPLLLLMAMQLETALSGYLDSGRAAGLQGRYWFGSLAAVAVLVALGGANVIRRRQRWLPLIALAAVGVMQAFALATILRFYWGDPGSSLTSRVRAVVAWAPLPGELIALTAIIAAVVWVVATLEIGRLVRPRAPREPADSALEASVALPR